MIETIVTMKPSTVNTTPTMMPMDASEFFTPAFFDCDEATALTISPTRGATKARMRPTMPRVLPG
jgi:hypothetical protein